MPDLKTSLFWWTGTVGGLVHVLDSNGWATALVEMFQKEWFKLSTMSVTLQLIVGVVAVVCGLFLWKDMMK